MGLTAYPRQLGKGEWERERNLQTGQALVSRYWKWKNKMYTVIRPMEQKRAYIQPAL